MLLPTLTVIDDREPHPAAVNMAIDEVLLRTVTEPTLRAYRWLTPAVSFGYFDRFREVRELYPDREVIRRWTGGGMVDHAHDFTYSLVIPAARMPPPRTVYAAVHRAVADALGGVAILAEAKGEPKRSNHCFENPVADDVVWAGKKVAGAAQRRTRSGLLLQGSIQHPIAEREAFLTIISEKISEVSQSIELEDDVIALSSELAGEKYATDEWTNLR